MLPWVLVSIVLLIVAGFIAAYVYFDRKVQVLSEEIRAYESFDITEEDSP